MARVAICCLTLCSGPSFAIAIYELGDNRDQEPLSSDGPSRHWARGQHSAKGTIRSCCSLKVANLKSPNWRAPQLDKMIDYYEPKLDVTLLGCGFLGEFPISLARVAATARAVRRPGERTFWKERSRGFGL